MSPNPGCPAVQTQIHFEQKNVDRVPDGLGMARPASGACKLSRFFLSFCSSAFCCAKKKGGWGNGGALGKYREASSPAPCRPQRENIKRLLHSPVQNSPALSERGRGGPNKANSLEHRRLLLKHTTRDPSQPARQLKLPPCATRAPAATPAPTGAPSVLSSA